MTSVAESTPDRTSIPIIFTAQPSYAHLEKIIPFAKSLVERGHPVTLITSQQFGKFLVGTGVQFERLDGVTGIATSEEIKTFLSLPPAEAQWYFVEVIGVRRIPDWHNTLQRVLARLKKRYEQVVYIHDCTTLGLLPQQLGAPGLLPTVSMSLGVIPITLSSKDTFPFPSTKTPDTSPDRQAIHHAAYEQAHVVHPGTALLDKALVAMMAQLSVPEAAASSVGFWDALGAKDNYLLQLGLRGFEYDRFDLVPKLVHLGIPEQFGGIPASGGLAKVLGVFLAKVAARFGLVYPNYFGHTVHDLPAWWSDVTRAKEMGRSVVVVSQGTISLDQNALLIPTFKGLKDRKDLLVIGTTGFADPSVVPIVAIPDNARIAKFVPFDQLLPYADILVAAGGYGTVLQSIASGVPMVHAGVEWDKIHIGTLSAYKGIAINLKTSTPTTEQIVDSVNAILGDGRGKQPDGSYRRNVEAMAEAAKTYRPFEIIDKAILGSLGY